MPQLFNSNEPRHEIHLEAQVVLAVTSMARAISYALVGHPHPSLGGARERTLIPINSMAQVR